MFKRLRSGVKKFWAGLALLSAEMLIITGIFFLSLMAFIFITRRVFLLHNEDFDNKVFDIIKPYINNTNTSIMNFITFFGKHEFLIPANLLIIAYYVFYKKNKWYSIKVPTIAISSLLLMFGLKQFFARQRPVGQLLQEAKNFSFPSGHALMSVTFYGLLAYIVWHSVKNKTVKWTLIVLLILWILLVGISRVYLRRHYSTDVMAGFAMGFLWLVISLKVIRQIEKYSKHKMDAVVQQPAVPAVEKS
ncbi:MAG TPA: phosphatase PAP2 family protein [Chitinophagaceae bacterium]|jgi:undecaprenyl-diphosphatase|nr:phosphatase PAP2 family protein [Chitinophagaceae bacterium]